MRCVLIALLLLGSVACSRQEAREVGREARDAAEDAGGRAVDVVDDLDVALQNRAFVPAQMSATVGQEVTWTNRDGVAHTIEADNGSFKSGTLDPTESYGFRFTQKGAYPYHCSIHGAAMSGVVTVA